MESVEESCSYEDSLVSSENRRNMLAMVEAISSFRKREDIECSFCQDIPRIHSLHDAFRLYATALSCLVYHCESVEKTDLLVLFEAESFILKRVQSRVLWKISEVIEYQRSIRDTYEDALKDQLVAVFKTHYTEQSIKINCEQDIESVTYRYYKRLSDKMRRELDSRDLEAVLGVLFRRNEFTRFFRVFERSRKTQLGFRLALLLSADPECHVPTNVLLKEAKDFSFEQDGFFESRGDIESMQDIFELVGDTTDLGAWIERLHCEAHWRECVKVWAANREYDTGAVDNSMIELCIKHSHHEDGWLIYRKSPCTTSVSKICILCFNALRDSQDAMWISRIISVAKTAALRGDQDSCCAAATSILSRVCAFSEACRSEILRGFFEIVQSMGTSERVVNSLLQGILLLCTKCSDEETQALAAGCAGQVYARWKTGCREGFLFFRKQKKYDTQIYTSMLGVCDAVKDCEGFYSVCRDLKNANASLDRDLCIKLENFHSQHCKDCTLRKSQVITSKKGKVLIFHFLSKFQKT